MNHTLLPYINTYNNIPLQYDHSINNTVDESDQTTVELNQSVTIPSHNDNNPQPLNESDFDLDPQSIIDQINNEQFQNDTSIPINDTVVQNNLNQSPNNNYSSLSNSVDHDSSQFNNIFDNTIPTNDTLNDHIHCSTNTANQHNTSSQTQLTNSTESEFNYLKSILGVNSLQVNRNQHNNNRRMYADPGENRENIPLDFSTPDQINDSMQRLLDKRYANNTKRNHNYAARVYIQFYQTIVSKNNELRQLQPHPFPIHSYVYQYFLAYMRGELCYAYRTVRDCFINDLNVFIEENNDVLQCESPRQQYHKKILHTMRALLRVYGSQPVKVNPILNHDYFKWINQLSIVRPNHAELLALIAVLRYTGARGDSLKQVKFKHITIKVISDENATKNVRLITEIQLTKDKNIETTDRLVTIYGKQNHSICPCFLLLSYVMNVRKALTFNTICISNTISQMKNQQLQFNQNYLNEFLFNSQSTPNTPMTNESMSNKLKNSSYKILNKVYSTRSFRTGFICQCIINGMKSNEGTLTNDVKERLRIQLGHMNEHAIDYYYRSYVTKYMTTSTMIDNHSENDENFQQIVQNNIENDATNTDTQLHSNSDINENKTLNYRKTSNMKNTATKLPPIRIHRQLTNYLYNNDPTFKNIRDNSSSSSIAKGGHHITYFNKVGKVLLKQKPHLISEQLINSYHNNKNINTKNTAIIKIGKSVFNYLYNENQLNDLENIFTIIQNQ
jgi:hypothetical protein